VNKVSQRLILAALTVVVFLLVASYFLAMLLGPSLFFLTPAGIDFSRTSQTGQLFMLIWSVFVLCFVVAWSLRDSFHEVIRRAFSRPLSKIFNNWLFVMPIIASMLFSAVFLIIDVQDMFRIPTGAIPEPKTDLEFFDLYLNLSYVSVVEEIGFRLAPIGTFLFAYLFLVKSVERTIAMPSRQRFKLFLFSFFYPEGAKQMVGEKSVAVNGIFHGISRGEWIMLLITSITFGASHVVSGIGWEIGKVTSTFIQGFVFGIVYMAYGFQAPILMHWFFNYYFYTYELSAKYYPNTTGILSFIENFNLTLGRLGLIAFLFWVLMKISKRRFKASREPNAVSP